MASAVEMCSTWRISTATLRDENPLEGAFGANAGSIEPASSGAGDVGRSRAPVGGHSRRTTPGEVRSEVREAAAGSISFAARRRGDRARRPGRGAGEGVGHQGPFARGSDQERRRNRVYLPAHLPQVERVLELASTFCSCGCGAMTKIGEDISKRST